MSNCPIKNGLLDALQLLSRLYGVEELKWDREEIKSVMESVQAGLASYGRVCSSFDRLEEKMVAGDKALDELESQIDIGFDEIASDVRKLAGAQ